MKELFYYPGACSLAAHIALLEGALPHTLHRVDLTQGEHLGSEYRAVHPLGRIPALRLEDGSVLSEVGAILCHLDALSHTPTLPSEGLAHIRVLEWLSLFASGVHIPFAMHINPSRFTDDPAAFETLRRDGRAKAFEMLRYVDERLDPRGTVLPGAYSVLDSYALVFFLWGMRARLPLEELPNYVTLAKNQMLRQAVQTALGREDLSSIPKLIEALRS